MGRPGDSLASKSDDVEGDLQSSAAPGSPRRSQRFTPIDSEGEGEEEDEGREGRETRDSREEGDWEDTEERPTQETTVDPLEAPIPEQPEEDEEEEEKEDGEFVDEPPKRVRIKIPKAAPVSTRPPIKITINHPPALTRKQKAALRQKWDPSQLTAEAYVSPEGLVAALQSLYRQTVTPWKAAPPVATSEGILGGDAVEAEGQEQEQSEAVVATGAVLGAEGESVPFPAVDTPPVVPPLPEGSAPADPDAPVAPETPDPVLGPATDAPASAPAPAPAPETPSPAVPSLAPHLLALLDPSLARAKAAQAANASAAAAAGALKVLGMSSLSQRDARDLRTPLPINADCRYTLSSAIIHPNNLSRPTLIALTSHATTPTPLQRDELRARPPD